jgi:hypothetical protein
MPRAPLKAVSLTPLQRKFERPGVLFALLILLMAQLGAQLHTYAHGEAQGLEAPRHSMPVSHGACGDCLAFAPLLLTAGTPARLPHFSAQARASAPQHFSLSAPDEDSVLAFRSRAPPLDQPA